MLLKIQAKSRQTVARSILRLLEGPTGRIRASVARIILFLQPLDYLLMMAKATPPRERVAAECPLCPLSRSLRLRPHSSPAGRPEPWDLSGHAPPRRAPSCGLSHPQNTHKHADRRRVSTWSQLIKVSRRSVKSSVKRRRPGEWLPSGDSERRDKMRRWDKSSAPRIDGTHSPRPHRAHIPFVCRLIWPVLICSPPVTNRVRGASPGRNRMPLVFRDIPSHLASSAPAWTVRAEVRRSGGASVKALRAYLAPLIYISLFGWISIIRREATSFFLPFFNHPLPRRPPSGYF